MVAPFTCTPFTLCGALYERRHELGGVRIDHHAGLDKMRQAGAVITSTELVIYEWLERGGGFNEGLLTNEDYEYNVRIRSLGGVVWFNPAIRSAYLARPDLTGLARQYARYGFWKARMLLHHPRSIRWRQAIPPLFVLITLGLLVSSPWSALAQTGLAVEWAAYLAVLLLFGCLESIRRRRLVLLLGFPLAAATIHLSWGSAFWLGLLSGLRWQPSD